MPHPHDKAREADTSSFDDVLYTNRQTAEILGVHEKSLIRARTYGGPMARLPHVRVGRSVRYRRSEIERYLRANTAHHVSDHLA